MRTWCQMGAIEIGGPMTEPASPSQLLNLSTELAALVAQATPSVVAVLSHRSRSTGFVWRPGLIITADEALAEEGEFAVQPPGRDEVSAQLLGRDPSTDIALLRVNHSDMQPVTTAAAPTAAGALAIAVGVHDGSPTAALGVVSRVSGPWRSLRGGEIDARIELDVRLRRSAEGGLALNASGQAIGMAVFGPRRRVLVIPFATIDRVAPRLEAHGRIARGYLGLGLQPVTVEGGGAGAMVMSVDPQGPSAGAGLHQGDIIVAVNDESVRHIRSLLGALGPDSVGKTMALAVRRAGEAHKITLKVAERPMT
jgi:S1-C subfamily serine protease